MARSAAREVQVDIVSDVVCPWCVIGYRQLARAAERRGITLDVRWHPFQLNPGMADEGEDMREHLARKYGTSPARSAETRAMLSRLGAEVGFDFAYADDMRIHPTLRAHELLHWAAASGRRHALKQALFLAYFSAGRDINDPAVLVEVAASVGLDAEQARAVLADRRYAEAVRAEAASWTRRGINGVPAMLFEGRDLMVGARGVEGYGALLDQLVAARG